MPDGWQWDPTLYRGSAKYYEQGRLPYPTALANTMATALGLDRSGRLIDVGCGPGTIALRLAHRFDEVVGIDADPEMVDLAASASNRRGITNTRWVRVRAEDLPANLGTFRIATFGQSFHWMDRERVAKLVYAMLEPGGALVHVHHWSITGDPATDSPHPLPPYGEIAQLVERFLGPTRRARRGTLPHGTPGGEDAVLSAAGFGHPVDVLLPGGEVVITSIADIVARTFSTSNSTPHLFGDQRADFEIALVDLLAGRSTDGHFAERIRDARIVIWPKPTPEPS